MLNNFKQRVQFELVFNKNGRIIYTPETKNNEYKTWRDFEETSFMFIFKNDAEVHAVSEKFAREILGDKKVDNYIDFCKKAEIEYTIKKSKELLEVARIEAMFHYESLSMSENFTQGFHLNIGNGKVPKYIYEEDGLDDIFYIIER